MLALRRLLALAPLCLGACHCTDAVAPAAAPAHTLADPVLTPLWAPTAGVLPFPDGLVLDHAAAGVLPAPDALDGVTRELVSLLHAHGGFPIGAAAAIAFDSAVDAATLDQGLLLLRARDGSRVDTSAALTLEGRGVRLRPGAPLVAGDDYVLVVTEALRGADGRFAGTPASFAWTRADEGALDDDEIAALRDALPGEDAAARRAAADALIQLRPRTQDALGVAMAHGLDDEDVVLAVRFSAVDAPTPVLDVAARAGPWPSDLMVDDDGRSLPPPHDALADVAGVDADAIAAAVAEVPGFSTSARIHVPLAGRIDDPSRGFFLYRLDGAETAAAVADLDATSSEDGARVLLKKRPALDAGARYAIVVTDEARAGGRSLAPPIDAALMRARAALALDGKSTTALLLDDEARRLEVLRVALTPLFDSLDARGTTREHVALALPFSTLDAFSWIDGFAQQLDERGIAPVLHDVVVENPWDRGLWAVMPNVDNVVSGSFTSLDFLDATTLRQSADGARAFEIPFVLSLPPPGDDVDQPIPVVVFGHGLLTAKELSYLIADLLAQHGYATFAIDLPFHGERTACLADGDCALGSHCTPEHRCVDGDGAPSGFLAGTSPWQDGPSIPLATGKAFMLVDDLVASRDHFLQGSIDVRQALRLLASGALDAHTGARALSTSDHSWLGVSLGGVYGAAIAGLTDQLGSLVLNVPGADVVLTLEESSVLSTQLDQMLDAFGIERGSAAFMAYEDLAHHVLDPIDPLNLAPRATVRAPPQWREKRLLLQMADTDRVVPNSATQVLSLITGAPIHEYHALISNHGFFLDPTSAEGADARAQMIDFLGAR